MKPFSALPEHALEERVIKPSLFVGVLTSLSALALYAYLGIFSRYSSDDYCLSAFFLQRDVLGAMIRRYFEASNRYTNILFIGLADRLFGWYNVAILPALMLVLFVLGLYLFLKEIAERTSLRWSRTFLWLLSLLLVYFSVAQAPDLYQTLYWRAGMTSHFAPLVFIPFFGTFLLRQINNAGQHAPGPGVQAACFLIPFLIGGLSEPPTALMITVLALGMGAAWLWGDRRYRRSILSLLFWSLAGALTALIVMALAPANSLRMQTPPPLLPELVARIVSYPAFFIIDTLRALPVPTLISAAVTALFFYVKYMHPSAALSMEARKRLAVLLIVVLVLAYLLVAASFAPSAYGQSYPAPRARFAGRFIMTAALMVEGALLGSLIAQVRMHFLPSAYVRSFAALVFLILMLYPLRTVQRLYTEVPIYGQRAAAWDSREAEIRTLKAEGEQDLVVRFLPDDPIQDLGDRATFRLNRCAATLYGVNSILAVPMED
jgi:hypothetical protein